MAGTQTGTYAKIPLASVRRSAPKTIAYLNNALPRVHARPYTVVFLGEQHRNPVDVAVAGAMLAAPPLLEAGRTSVLFERPLRDLNHHVPSPRFHRVEQEPDRPVTTAARNAVLGDMVLRAFDADRADDRMLYVVCGSAHAEPMFAYLDAKMKRPFTFIAKLSDTDP